MDFLQKLPDLLQHYELPGWLQQYAPLLEQWLDKQTLNTLLLAFLVFLIGRARKRTRDDLEYYSETISQKLSALRAEVESIPEPSPESSPTATAPDAGRQYWEQIVSLWSSTRQRIDTLIEELPARARKPYSRFDGRSYVPMIERLCLTDRKITHATAQLLLNMSGIFNQNRPTASKTKRETAIEFKKLFDAAIKELPQPPNGDDDETLSAVAPGAPATA
jgi:hypothetical protein